MAAIEGLGRLHGFKRIVIKIGSSLLVDGKTGALRKEWLLTLAQDVAKLKRAGLDVMLVSSGAIALGRRLLKLDEPKLRLEESQAAASVGQIALAQAYADMLGQYNITIGQILLTLGDTENRRSYLNARATIATLLAFGAVPVVNENDTVATQEIRYGDNDRLAARMAVMASADLLILLSDVDGLYTAPPAYNPEAQHIAHIPIITAEIVAMAGDPASHLSRGGMRTKIDAAKMATQGGATMIIANGHNLHPISAIIEGGRSTWFDAHDNPANARKSWIMGTLAPAGELIIDDGAIRALKAGNSLLPVGVTAVKGVFRRGDCVRICAAGGFELARGLVSYDAVEAQKLMGCRSQDIEDILGYNGRTAIVHRDDLVLVTQKDHDAG